MMIDLSDNYIEKIVVIEPLVDNYNDNLEELKNEIFSLIESADAIPLSFVAVKVREINPATFIGTGKLEEIRQIAEEFDANCVLFDGQLSPSQTVNMSDLLGVKVIDRTTLILDIFAKNAKSHEGKLQVELAQLNYMYPRLKGKGASLSRLGGGIGTRGPGETQLETDRRHIRTRIDYLKNQLEDLKTRRNLQSYRRSKNSETVVSLVGYTNTGKSTLLNLLTGSNVLAENKLFATLDPTIRKAKIDELELLIVDTVGFIKNIPTNIVEAFNSTLESAVSSDLNLIVLDGSGAWENQLEVTLSTLKQLKSNSEYIIVVNKCDKIEDFTYFPKDAIFISAKTGYGIENLKKAITDKLLSSYVKTTLVLEYSQLKEVNKLLNYLESFEFIYNDTEVLVNITVKKIYFDKFIKFKKVK